MLTDAGPLIEVTTFNEFIHLRKTWLIIKRKQHLLIMDLVSKYSNNNNYQPVPSRPNIFLFPTSRLKSLISEMNLWYLRLISSATESKANEKEKKNAHRFGCGIVLHTQLLHINISICSAYRREKHTQMAAVEQKSCVVFAMRAHTYRNGQHMELLRAKPINR